MAMTRMFIETPGFDCRNGRHAGCTGRVDHGVGSTEWRFAVHADGAALNLLMFTPYFPDTVTIDESLRRFHCRNLAVCTTWPTEDSVIASGAKPAACPYLGKCYFRASWGLLGDEFMTKHFVEAAGKEQPESFWRAMEAFLTEYIAPLRAAPRRKQCDHCAGTGVVDREAE